MVQDLHLKNKFDTAKTAFEADCIRNNKISKENSDYFLNLTKIAMEQNPKIKSTTLGGKYIYVMLDKIPMCHENQIAVSETGKRGLIVAMDREQLTIEPFEEIVLGKDFAVYENISFGEKATPIKGNEKVSPERIKRILQDLESQISGLQYRIRERVGERPSHIFTLNTSAIPNDKTAEEIIRVWKTMGLQTIKAPEQKEAIEELDLRVDVEYITSLLIELRILQDQHYEFCKVKSSLHE